MSRRREDRARREAERAFLKCRSCDRLEASLATADETRRRLLEALLAEALAPDEDRELEAAE